MATIINNPGDSDGSGSAVGVIVGGIALLIVIGLFFMYALPAMRSNGAVPQGTDLNVNVKLPADATPPAVPTPTPAPTPTPTPAPTPAQ